MNWRSEKFAFFRQSGWMVLATTSSGVFMFAVHVFAGMMKGAEYAVFTTLLQVLNLMLIPSIGLQTVFAQQVATITSDEDRRRLAGTARVVLAGLTVLWMVMAAGVWFSQRHFISLWKITNPAALWFTLGCGLAMLWLPIVQGIMQGRLNFLWYGWATIVNGLGRLITVGIVVAVLGGQAASAMFGALLGLWIAVAIGLWQSRTAFQGPAEPFQPAIWLRQVIPLTLGLGASMFMLSADQIVVQSLFSTDVTPYYSAAGTIARGLVIFTTPMTAVMFPRIVQSAARSERTDVLMQALAATVLMGSAVCLGCSLFPELPLRIVFRNPDFLEAARWLPGFTWAMLPLALANVLVCNLLARRRFGVVPWLALVVAAYAAALATFNGSFSQIILTIGLFNLLFFCVAVLFTRLTSRESSRSHQLAGGTSD